MPRAREEENPKCLDISPTRRGPEDENREEKGRKGKRSKGAMSSTYIARFQGRIT
jgi:hypothetical protein